MRTKAEQMYITPAFVTSEDIKQVRKKLKMTQKAFAEFVGVSKPTVARWEESSEKITGAITLLVTVLMLHPEFKDDLVLPKRNTPIRMKYYHKNMLCTVIDVDEINQRIYIKNYTDNLLFRAFGRNTKPTFADYEEFLESRCFPRERDKMKLMLKEFDLPFYDPFMIVEKTQGRMSEDDFRIEIER